MKFQNDKCEVCGAKLARKTPEDVERYGEPYPGEESFPERYVAKCPSCGNYNLVEGEPGSKQPEPKE
jgi:rRNA maturation protein Nop10